jgi:hypothetical protein
MPRVPAAGALLHSPGHRRVSIRSAGGLSRARTVRANASVLRRDLRGDRQRNDGHVRQAAPRIDDRLKLLWRCVVLVHRTRVAELTEEDTMKRVALLPLLFVLAAASAGCVTYDGVDENGKHSKSRTLIDCRQSGAIACRMLPQNPKGQTLDDVTYMRLPK